MEYDYSVKGSSWTIDCQQMDYFPSNVRSLLLMDGGSAVFIVNREITLQSTLYICRMNAGVVHTHVLEHKVTQVAAIGGREVLYLVPEADEWVVLNVFTYEVKRGSWKYITPKVTQVKLVSLPSSRTLVIWETDHEISKTSFV